MFEFGGHGEDDGTEGIAGCAKGMGDLLGMSALALLLAVRAVAGLDVELRDDGNNGRQVGLILDADAGADKLGLTVGALRTRDLDDAVDVFGGRCGPIGSGVAFASTWLFGPFLGLSTTEGSGLSMGLSFGLVETLAEEQIVVFEFFDAALQLGNLAVTFLATEARRHHGTSLQSDSQ